MALAPEVSVATTVVLCLALSGLAYSRNVLTWDGAVAAFVVGLLIGVFGDVTWLLLLFGTAPWRRSSSASSSGCSGT